MKADGEFINISDNYWFRYGLIGALIAIFIYASIYIVVPEKLFETGFFSYLPILIIVVSGIMAAISEKKSNGGYIEFGQAFKQSILAYLVSLFIYSLFIIILFFVIDPDMLVAFKNAGMREISRLEEAEKITKEQAEEGLRSIEKMGDNLFAFQTTIGFFIMGIFGAILYLVSSAIIKNNKQASL